MYIIYPVQAIDIINQYTATTSIQTQIAVNIVLNNSYLGKRTENRLYVVLSYTRTMLARHYSFIRTITENHLQPICPHFIIFTYEGVSALSNFYPTRHHEYVRRITFVSYLKYRIYAASTQCRDQYLTTPGKEIWLKC